MPETGTVSKAEEIVGRVKNLPPLPAVLQKLVMVLEDMSCSAKDIERLVTTDPALTARILRLANSPLYKGIEEVSTISHAVTRLGFMKLRDVAISIGTTETLSEMADEEIQQRYWHHAVYTATCAKAMAATAGLPVPEVTFVSGLLHDIGELVLAAVSPEQFADLQKIESHRRLQHEEELFGSTHPRIGAQLLKQWLLPRPLCDAVRMHHNEQVITSKREPIISLVALADFMSKIHGLGSEPNSTPKTLFVLAKRAGVPIDQIATILHQVDEQVADTQRHLEIAGDVSFLTPPQSLRNYNVAIASTAPAMTGWLQEIISYLGHTPVSLPDFLAAPDEMHLVILDAKAAGSSQLDALKPALEATRGRIVVVGSQTESLPRCLQEWELPEIDMFLTQKEIKHYAQAVTQTVP